jgi:hypothetical protein
MMNRLAKERNDPHDHGWFIEVFSQQRGLLFRFAPPPNDFRSPQPDVKEREILFHHRAKRRNDQRLV